MEAPVPTFNARLNAWLRRPGRPHGLGPLLGLVLLCFLIVRKIIRKIGRKPA